MKELGSAITALSQNDIADFEATGAFRMTLAGKTVDLSMDDVEIISEDIPGWQVANEGKLTVALDVTVTDELRYEGIAREFVNRIQNIRKESGYDVTDKIKVLIQDNEFVSEAVKRHARYIGSQTLATEVVLSGDPGDQARDIEIDDVVVKIRISRD